jgi:hypothetical protein
LKVSNYLGTTMEKVKSFTIKEVAKFVDIQQFDHRSVASMIDALHKAGPDHFKFTKQVHPTSMDLITKKFSFAYDDVTSLDKLNDVEVPTIDKFYSALTKKGITKEEYLFVLELYARFEFEDLYEYMALYCSIDSLCMLDYIIYFSKSIADKHHGLALSRHVTGPSLFYNDYMLTSKTRIGLITDVLQYLIVESGICGGYCDVFISEYIKENKDVLMSLDFVSLYPYIMTTFRLYQGNMQTVEGMTKEQLMAVDANGTTGYIVVVDAHVPDNKHKDLQTFAVFHVNATTDELLSPFQQQTFKDAGLKPPSDKRLIGTNGPVKGFTCDLRYLQFIVKELGVVIDKVEHVLTFDQSYHMKEYVQKCVDEKVDAPAGSIERCIAKLSANCIFGKSCQNCRNRRTFKLCFTDEEFAKVMKNPLVKAWSTLTDDGLRLVELHKSCIKGDSPIAIGMQILSLAKLHNMEMYYKWLHPKVMKTVDPNDPEEYPLARVFYADTDSISVSLPLAAQKRLAKVKDEKCNFNAYDEKSPLWNSVHKRTIGVYTDEYNGNNPEHALFVRPKCYSAVDANGERIKKSCKGVQDKFVPPHSSYVDVVKNNAVVEVEVTGIRSFQMQNYIVTANKKAVCGMSTKRYFTDKNTSVPFGDPSLGTCEPFETPVVGALVSHAKRPLVVEGPPPAPKKRKLNAKRSYKNPAFIN